MQATRALALMLGSGWFFPVSCSTGLFLGTPLVTRLHERHMDQGAAPHAMFHVVWQGDTGGESFGYSRLAALSDTRSGAPARNFLMVQPTGRIEGEKQTVVTYQVLGSDASEQLIEVAWSDDTFGSLSRYRATESTIVPVFSRVVDPAFMFMAFPPALLLAALIYSLGRRLRREGMAKIEERGNPDS